MTWIDRVVDQDVVPDWILRAGIRAVVAGRLREQEAGGVAAQQARRAALLESFRRAAIAVETAAANAQHYQVPAAFFQHVLGPHLKYSSAWWPEGVRTLADAEERMLALTADRAGIADGQRVLELGCGWGSLTLFLAARYPHLHITCVSNSSSQASFIRAAAAARGLSNIEIVTADVNHFEPDGTFDRVVSVEMFEHVRNHAALFARIARWLQPDGRLFVHVFAHRRFAYPFESAGSADWMARYFFTGGMMPSDDLFLHYSDDLTVEQQWRLSGVHYQRTAQAWLENFDRNPAAMDRILADTYGADQVTCWRARWRVFFMACAEMFGYRGGEEWIVSHYLFKRRD